MEDQVRHNDFELLRQDFRLLLNEVYELRRLLEAQDENKSEYFSVPQFAKLIGLSSTRIRQLCETGMIKAVQPGNDRGRWKILSTELKRFRSAAQANNFNELRSRKGLSA